MGADAMTRLLSLSAAAKVLTGESENILRRARKIHYTPLLIVQVADRDPMVRLAEMQLLASAAKDTKCGRSGGTGHCAAEYLSSFSQDMLWPARSFEQSSLIILARGRPRTATQNQSWNERSGRPRSGPAGRCHDAIAAFIHSRPLAEPARPHFYRSGPRTPLPPVHDCGQCCDTRMRCLTNSFRHVNGRYSVFA